MEVTLRESQIQPIKPPVHLNEAEVQELARTERRSEAERASRGSRDSGDSSGRSRQRKGGEGGDTSRALIPRNLTGSYRSLARRGIAAYLETAGGALFGGGTTAGIDVYA